jgi:hydroxypyruvate isomerase
MSRLSANIRWIFTEVPFFDRFDAAAKAGFRAVEYGWPYTFEPADIRARLAAHDLRLVLINTPQGEAARGEASGQACLPGREAAFRDNLKRALDYAAALDCDMVHVQAGVRPAEVPEARAWDVYLANLSWACEAARSSGIKLIIEPVNQRDIPGFFLRTQAQAAEAIAAVGADRLGVLFDIYHCQAEEGDVIARLEKAMPTIGHIQIADVPGRGEPGTGDIDWASTFSRIKELGYAGWIGCEYKPATTTLAGLEWRTRFDL